MTTAKLVLTNGSVYEGYAFGVKKNDSGEVVFSTAMVGYPESLTDPSYAGQILCVTYPLIGNYGVPQDGVDQQNISLNFESEKIWVRGLIIGEYSAEYSHWDAIKSLDQWLQEQGVTGIYGIDTRALTQELREEGNMLGKIIVENDDAEIDFYDPNKENLIAQVSCRQVIRYSTINANSNTKTICMVDCGVKHNILRCFIERGVNIIRVPWDYDFNQLEWDGLFISNGPGNPEFADITISNLQTAMKGDKPIFGICMGNQLLARAAGASTYKLHYGHRSHNQPVRIVNSNRCFVTSQNHGYAVDDKTLDRDWEAWFVNMNDGTNEGIRHKTKPFFSVQFHPEASSGPTDTGFLFDEFINCLSTHSLPFVTDLVVSVKNEIAHNVLVLGSGALKIGQAGEFDYSGSQALKALREEGIRTVLINPNIATVQTSEQVADKIYFLPVTVETVEKVIKEEHIDGILLAFGGQTALNCGVELYERGILLKYGVQVLGTPVETIIDTEDRERFVERLDQINVKTIRSFPASSVQEALQAANHLGYPLIIRAAYALGGLGSGFVDNDDQLQEMCKKAFAFSPQVLVEKSLRGWKEIEYEVVRDRFNNCVTICNMENFDPLGIHTGESIVVAPSQTLTNKDYYFLRELSQRIVRHLGVVGECNVQFAYDPNSMDYRVIEVNARLSRSSALASKATGYPLAFVAAKLGLGYGLFDLKNSVTKTTPAFFEPALDYIVCKIPRWDLSKFRHVSRKIGSSMKSVGEVMSIGRSFEEAIQKGLRMIGQGAMGFVCNKPLDMNDIEEALSEPTDMRIFVIAQAMQNGMSVEKIHQLTKIDRWFLNKLSHMVNTGKQLSQYDTIHDVPCELLTNSKRQGFSDLQIQYLVYKGKGNSHQNEDLIRLYRKEHHILPVVKQIDTLAAEFPAQTNYLYLTYNGTQSDLLNNPTDNNAIIVLGSGAYRIGSSVEFDWCSVSCLQEIQAQGYRGVMINYNPETVSTDYDICNRLYFDELTLERVLDICDIERPEGVVVSVGGQIPNNLALPLMHHDIRILGTSPIDIDRAEDRHKFSSIVDSLGIGQPEWKELTTLDEVESFIQKVGFPVLVRPSYVLSGAAMNVCYDRQHLQHFLALAADVSAEHPVVISKFMTRCKEIEFDAVAKDGKIIASAISEHIEYAGVHSGDATIVYPAQKIYVATERKIQRAAALIANELHITGPFNIQFLAKENEVKVIECNLRASRSFPFVSKVMRYNLIKLATRALLDLPVSDNLQEQIWEAMPDYVGVKSAQFSFARLQDADPMLGVDMSSTGEVGCLGTNIDEALLKSLLSVGQTIPQKRILISSGDALQKADLLLACQLLNQNGYQIFATKGTYKYLTESNISCVRVLWPDEESDNSAMRQAIDMIQQKDVDMVINIPKDFTEGELTNGYQIRRAAVDFNIPLFTNARLATAFIRAFCSEQEMQIVAWNEYK